MDRNQQQESAAMYQHTRWSGKGKPTVHSRSRGAAATWLISLFLIAGCGSDHPLYLDNDGDGFCERVPCDDGSQYGDCNDFDASIYPGADEVCNGVDDDCDGQLGDGETDGDLDGFLPCQGDCDDANAAVHPGAPERCSGLDDDCDGLVDPAGALGCVTFYADQDDDGYGVDDDWACLCAPTSPYTAARRNDCNDDRAATNPGAVEQCNGFDDNCDGTIDEGFDADLDGAVVCSVGATPADCDDNDPDLNQQDADADGATSCDGDCDDNDPAVNLRDDDGDGYPTCPVGQTQADCDDNDPDLTPQDTDGDGFSSCDGDCDDMNPAVHPGAPELCNGGVDDDCDPSTVETADADGDGFQASCDGDCDDMNPAVYPGANDVPCDGIDADCDGTTEWLVTPADTETDGSSPIQQAIDSAAPGDMVCVAAGTYTGTLNLAGKALTLLGVQGPDATMLDGAGDGPVLTIANGEGPDTTVSGFTLLNGHAYQGGGLYVRDASPTVSNLVISGNMADHDGGGIYVGFGSSPVITDIQVQQNTSGGKGGGLYLDTCSPLVDGLEVTGNQAGSDGGGAYLADVATNARVANTTFTLNAAPSGYGGGLYLSASSPALEDLEITYNTADYASGMELVASDATLSRVVVSDNVATQNYGGIYIHTSSPSLTDVDISHNSAVGSQAGLSLSSSAPNLRAVTIRDNTAANYAGLNLWSGSNAILETVTIADNEATINYCGLTVTNSSPTLDFVTITGNIAHGAFGGGVRLTSSSPSFTHVLIADNESPRDAGGVAVTNASHPTFDAVIVAGNRAYSAGGGISVSDTSSITMNNVTVVGNSAGTYGGGIQLEASERSVIENAIVAFNSASVCGGGINVSGGASQVELEYSDLHGNTGGDACGWTFSPGADGNLTVDPAFVGYDPSQPPETWDLHLSADSPIIDAGVPDVKDADETRSDMGAYGGPEGEW